jgi:GT2 family glycosyltransferase
MPPRIAVVVVNWNRAHDTLRCLAALLASDYPNFETIVVDNASTDNSAEAIAAAYPAATFLHSPVNAGFSGGNNLGLRHGLQRGAEYLFLLNNDAVVEPGTLSALAAAASAHPQAGFLGATICALEDPRQVLSAGGRLAGGWRPEHIGMGQAAGGGPAEPVPVEFLSGAALLARRRAVETIGLLDEDFFLYYEDVEWCWRASQAGFGRPCFAPRHAFP